MKYALWRLKLEENGYYSGPEQTIYEIGGFAESSWTNGSIEDNASILGYVTGDFSLDLSAWSYQEITEAEALAFCQSINPQAYLLEDGRIAAPETIQ